MSPAETTLDGVRRTGARAAAARPLHAASPLLHRAVDEARAVVAARAEMHRTARAEGLEEGRRALAAVTRDLADALARHESRHAEDVAELALVVAESVIGAHLATDPEALASVVRALVADVLDRARGYEGPVLRLHPDDVAALDEEALPDPVRIERDASLARGAVELDTTLGRFRTSVADRLDEVRARLRRALETEAATESTP